MNKINILHLEDSLKDSELVYSLIESGEINCNYYLADNEKDFLNILKTENIDIILSDNSIPGYKGRNALKFSRQNYSQIPFIFVSGTLGEDAAIHAMLDGATDYVLKNKLERLVPAIKRALHEHELEINHIKSENALRESEERLKAIFNDAPMGIALIDSISGRIHTVNPKFAEIAGRTIEEMNNVNWMSITHPDDIHLDLNKMTQFVAGEINGFQMEKRYVHPDGSFVWVSMTVSPILYNEDSSPRHLCMIEDVTSRRQAKQELIIANQELIFHNQEKEKRAVELILANKELAFQNEEKEKRAAELILAVEKAKESDRLKSAFLSNMSHEIRTPMNGLLGFTSMLLDPDLTSETQREYIGIIKQCGNRMLSTVNDILDISKIESGQVNVTISETNINEQLKNIYSIFKPEAEEKGIQIFYKNTSSTKETLIKTDPDKLRHILTNLVKNAIKFTRQGFIEFGCNLMYTNPGTDEPNAAAFELEFYIQDTGIGIRPEDTQFIFERFRQSKESVNRTYEGAGLGLAISKAYIEMLNGKIWVESEIGQGSTFHFTLPYNVSPEL